MACSSPIARVTPELCDELGLWKYRKSGLITSRDYASDVLRLSDDQIQLLGCGSCFGCRMEYSKQWALRCMLEASYYERNYFVTLTYDDYHLPSGQFLDFGGEVKDTSLCREDLVKFIKRFRQHCVEHYNHDGVRVFYCGEYGSLTDRPHYHIIFFNCPAIDLTFYKRSPEGGYYYHSKDIYDTWRDRDKVSIGFHTVSELNYNMCAYTARYMLKKQKGQSVKDRLFAFDNVSDTDLQLRSNVFCGMSLKPGIGRRYYDEHKDQIYDTDQILYNDEFKAYCAKPPRYFDKLYDIDEPGLMEFYVKGHRQERGEAFRSVVGDPVAFNKRQEEICLRKERGRCRSI